MTLYIFCFKATKQYKPPSKLSQNLYERQQKSINSYDKQQKGLIGPGEPMPKCGRCKMTFPNKTKLTAHLIVVHSSRMSSTVCCCHVCGESLCNSWSLKRHMHLRHNINGAGKLRGTIAMHGAKTTKNRTPLLPLWYTFLASLATWSKKCHSWKKSDQPFAEIHLDRSIPGQYILINSCLMVGTICDQ